MSIIFLLACSTDPAEPVSPDTDAPPSAHPYTTESFDEADVAALQSAFHSNLERVLSLQAAPVLDAYDAALVYGDKGCPNETVTEEDGTTTTHWQEVCTNALNESIFNGPMTTWTWDEGYMASQTLPTYDNLYQNFPQMYELRWTGSGLNGQTDITAAGGVDFNCSCLAITGRAQDKDNNRYAFIAVDGPSHWSGPEAEETWLEDDIQLRLSGFAAIMADGTRSIYLKGSASGLDDDYGAINFFLPFQTDGASCINQKFGRSTASIRNSQTGYWSHFDLTRLNPEDCIICTEDETFCLELAPLLSWEELPW